ncbi:MAG TPA: hypothetical protein VIK01_07680 [Polyangiaceae bacterium]
MKRLVDEGELNAADRQLAELFRSAPPFEVDPFRKRRVLVGLERAQRRVVSRFWLKPGVVAVVAVALMSGTAMAALGHRYVARGLVFLGLGSAPQATLVHSAAAPQHAAPRPVGLAAAAAPEASAQPAAEPEPAANTPPSALKGSNAPNHARPESAEDATRVVQAIQALRTGRDPSRAQTLLNEYMKAHPHGVLSEDALALSIEAASAQHDPRAADYARRYLASFPNGKYRTLANRALEKAASTLP